MRKFIFLTLILAFFAFLYGRSSDKSKQIASCPLSNQLALKFESKGEVAAMKKEQVRPLPVLAFLQGKDAEFFKDKITLLNLWATWCAPCKAEMPALDKLQAARGSAKFEVSTVNIDTRNLERADAFWVEAKITTLKNHKDNDAKIFQELKQANLAFGMPTSLLIGGDGCVFASLAGPAEWASPDAFALIDGLLK